MDLHVKSIASACCPAILRPTFERIENSPLGLRLVRGLFWSMAGTIISRGLTFVATVMTARILGRTIYGELGMINSTVGMFGVLAGFGMGLTATKHVAEFRQSDPVRAGHIINLAGFFAMLTSGVMALGLFYFAPWLAEYTLNAPHLTDVIRISVLILFISGINGAQTGALAGFEAFKTIAHVNLLVGLISFPTLICGAWFGGLAGAVWALSINLVFNWILNHIALRKECRRFGVPLVSKQCFQEWPVLWRFSLPAMLANILVSPANWACGAFMVNQANGYSEMGVFAAALLFQQILLVICGMLHPPLLSILANVGSSKNDKLETVNIILSWLIGLLPGIIMLCFPEIAELVFGKEYGGRSFRLTFAVTIFTSCILTYRSGLLRVLLSQGMLWLGFGNNLLWALILLPSAYYMSSWGALGLSLSYAIAYLAISVIFIPIYSIRCKVPSKLLFSREVLAIWLVIFILLAGVFLDFPLSCRVVMLPFAIGLVVLALRRVWQHNSDVNSPRGNVNI